MYMERKYKSEYKIADVLEADYPNIKHYGVRNGEEYIDCPFCGRKKKVNVSYIKNVFRCNACDTSGGVLKLHMLAKGFDTTKQAREDLKKNGCISNAKGANGNERIYEAVNENKPFPSFLLNSIYSNLLHSLELKEEDRQELLRRGLTLEDIERNKYRSYPSSMYTYLAEKSLLGTIQTTDVQTIEYFSDKLSKELGIPGYYSTHGDISLIYIKDRGFLIPIRNLNGEITSMQIRNFLSSKATEEEKENFSKYIWLSSKSKRCGCGVHEVNQIHFTGFDYQSDKTPQKVYLTEGCLKADVASSLMKQVRLTKENAPFIAVMGVNNTSQLTSVFAQLVERGTKEITLCYDMDYLTNPNVKKARDKVIELIKSSGLTAHVMKWDERYKGIDDYLLSIKNIRTNTDC